MKRIMRTALACLCGLLLLTSCGESVGETTISYGTETSAAATASQTQNTETTTSAAVTTVTAAATAATTTTTTTTTAEPEPVPVEITGPYCRAAELYCLDDGRVLYSKDEDQRISLASITKLLTASAALRYLSAETEITVGSEIGLAKENSTLAYLHYGERLKLKDLLAAMLLPSGNDAAYTVAAATARAMTPGGDLSDTEAVEFFVGLMNGLAEELEMNDSHFANPEGWDDPQHYTTVTDLMKLVRYAWSLPEIRETVGEHQRIYYYPDGTYNVWTNTNLFLDPETGFYDPDCIGIKTGTTADAGCCLVSAFVREGKTYLCAVMGCEENLDRFTLTRILTERF